MREAIYLISDIVQKLKQRYNLTRIPQPGQPFELGRTVVPTVVLDNDLVDQPSNFNRNAITIITDTYYECFTFPERRRLLFAHALRLSGGSSFLLVLSPLGTGADWISLGQNIVDGTIPCSIFSGPPIILPAGASIGILCRAFVSNSDVFVTAISQILK